MPRSRAFNSNEEAMDSNGIEPSVLLFAKRAQWKSIFDEYIDLEGRYHEENEKQTPIDRWMGIFKVAMDAALEWIYVEKSGVDAKSEASSTDRDIERKRRACADLKLQLQIIDSVVSQLAAIEETSGACIGRGVNGGPGVTGALVLSVCEDLTKLDRLFLKLGIDNFEVNSRVWKHIVSLYSAHMSWLADQMDIASMLLVALLYAEDATRTARHAVKILNLRVASSPKSQNERGLIASAKLLKKSVARAAMMIRLGRKLVEISPQSRLKFHETLRTMMPRLGGVISDLYFCGHEINQSLKLGKEALEADTLVGSTWGILTDAVASVGFFSEETDSVPLSYMLLREAEKKDWEILSNLWLKYAESVLTLYPKPSKESARKVMQLGFAVLTEKVSRNATYGELADSNVFGNTVIQNVAEGLLRICEWCGNAEVQEEILQCQLDHLRDPRSRGTSIWVASTLLKTLDISPVPTKKKPCIVETAGSFFARNICMDSQKLALEKLCHDLGNEEKPFCALSKEYPDWLIFLEQCATSQTSRFFQYMFLNIVQNHSISRICIENQLEEADAICAEQKSGGFAWTPDLFGPSMALERMKFQPTQDGALLFIRLVGPDISVLVKKLKEGTRAEFLVASNTLKYILSAAQFFSSISATLTPPNPFLDALETLVNLKATDTDYPADMKVLHETVTLRVRISSLLTKRAVVSTLTLSDVMLVVRGSSFSTQGERQCVIDDPACFAELMVVVSSLANIAPRVAQSVEVVDALSELCHSIFRLSEGSEIKQTMSMLAFERLARRLPASDRKALGTLLPETFRGPFRQFLERKRLFEKMMAQDTEESTSRRVWWSSLPLQSYCPKRSDGLNKTERPLNTVGIRALDALSSAGDWISGPSKSSHSEGSFARAWAGIQSIAKHDMPMSHAQRSVFIEQLSNFMMEIKTANVQESKT